MSTIHPHQTETITDPAPRSEAQLPLVAPVGPLLVIAAPTLSEALRFASPALEARLRRLYERASFDDYLFNALHGFAYGS